MDDALEIGFVIAHMIGILLNRAVTRLQHHMLRWLPNVRGEG